MPILQSVDPKRIRNYGSAFPAPRMKCADDPASIRGMFMKPACRSQSSYRQWHTWQMLTTRHRTAEASCSLPKGIIAPTQAIARITWLSPLSWLSRTGSQNRMPSINPIIFHSAELLRRIKYRIQVINATTRVKVARTVVTNIMNHIAALHLIQPHPPKSNIQNIHRPGRFEQEINASVMLLNFPSGRQQIEFMKFALHDTTGNPLRIKKQIKTTSALYVETY